MLNTRLQLPNGKIIDNRIVKSAMSEALADPLNNPSDALINLYKKWGKSGAGLLITGNTPIDRWHLEHAGNVVLDQKTDIAKMTELATAAKSGGAKVLVQLSHSGRQTPSAINPQPLSVSEIKLELEGYGIPQSATDNGFEKIIKQFSQSAALAKTAGFDGVEVHAAHGYLLSSSLSSRINTRTDKWGGSLSNRANLLLEVIAAIRVEVGQDFIIATKLNSSDFQKGGFSHQESIEVAKMLQLAGIDLLEISGGNFEAPVSYHHSAKSESTIAREAYFLDYAQDIKATLDIPVMVTGGFRSAKVMQDALEKGATDLIGIGRPFIIDPLFPKSLLSGEIDTVPAVERDFPNADQLPRGAVLNWFCHQLALNGLRGNADLSIGVHDGHQQYLSNIEKITEQLLEARKQHLL